MTPLWAQRRELKAKIRTLLDEYLKTKTHEQTREIALGWAMSLGDEMPLKKLEAWEELIRDTMAANRLGLETRQP